MSGSPRTAGWAVHALLKNGVFQIDDRRTRWRASAPRHPIHAAIAAKVLETPWDKLRAA